MSGEAIVERGDAPIARAASPLWQWAFIVISVILGVGALTAVLVSGLKSPATPATEDDGKPRLRFDGGAYEVPVFPRPTPKAPTAPEPPPTPPSVAVPPSPVVPTLPPPEPHHIPTPVVSPPAPVAPEKHVETPAELAAKRRLLAPLSGYGGGAPSTPRNEEKKETGRDTGGLDLSATKTITAFARRLGDLTLILPKGSYLNCILDTAIQSNQAGLVTCTLPEDVYGADGTVVLLDRGSQVLGEYRNATLTYGKRRIFVIWDRVRTPAGVIVDIASPGTGPLGQAGIGGEIDNHYWERVGIPVLMSSVSFGAESYAREALTPIKATSSSKAPTTRSRASWARWPRSSPRCTRARGTRSASSYRGIWTCHLSTHCGKAMAASPARDLLHDILGPIRPILAREDVTDLCINGPGRLFVEGVRGWEHIPAANLTSTWLHSFARAVASFMSATVSERAPILSGHLPTGERIQIVLPPAAEEPSITIRRPSHVTFTLDELADKGTFALLSSNAPSGGPAGDQGAARHRATVRARLADWRADDQTSVPAILREIVAHRLNVIVSGATGSGKTTLSKAMIAEIPRDERLIAIEDAKELQFPHANTARLFFSRDGAGVSPVTVKDLLVSCLRMKPDRIMLAELRDDEAYYYLRNVNSGHPGSITTIHANSATAAVEQLMLMVRQSSAGAGLSREDIRALVANLVDVIIQMDRKRVTEIYFLPEVGTPC
jgi:P-type DNA transfer ATPase VirB11